MSETPPRHFGDGVAYPPQSRYATLAVRADCAPHNRHGLPFPCHRIGDHAAYNLVTGRKPSTTLPGLIISLISIASMWALVSGRRKVGRALNSSPILADANCTLVCIYVSLVLLAASLVYQLTGIGFVDSLGGRWFDLLFRARGERVV
jgi:hypothetical protein